MNMGVDIDTCDTGLVLGLGCSDPPPRLRPSPSNTKLVEPSLTLGPSDDAYMSMPTKERRPSSSPHSTNSSLSSPNPSSIKREIDTVYEEAERVSSRTSDEDEDGGGARKKLRLTKEQSAILEDKFREHTTLNPKQKQALARHLNLRPRQVEVWFQNRRARTKLKQTEVDCEVLKRCCETLSDENRRLHKELEELKALRIAPPAMYMPVPTTLTVCPSCERVTGAGEGAKAVASGALVVAAPKAHEFLNPFARSAAC